ncbi:hypothetical protein JTB14_035002 [Gonioctena quinquepunctata]|nr:hypothetical protein JTB14_035002 [Gonioctena quinquepunctata]
MEVVDAGYEEAVDEVVSEVVGEVVHIVGETITLGNMTRIMRNGTICTPASGKSKELEERTAQNEQRKQGKRAGCQQTNIRDASLATIPGCREMDKSYFGWLASIAHTLESSITVPRLTDKRTENMSFQFLKKKVTWPVYWTPSGHRRQTCLTLVAASILPGVSGRCSGWTPLHRDNRGIINGQC